MEAFAQVSSIRITFPFSCNDTLPKSVTDAIEIHIDIEAQILPSTAVDIRNKKQTEQLRNCFIHSSLSILSFYVTRCICYKREYLIYCYFHTVTSYSPVIFMCIHFSDDKKSRYHEMFKMLDEANIPEIIYRFSVSHAPVSICLSMNSRQKIIIQKFH